MRIIRRGDRGHAVRDVQRRLLSAGFGIQAEELEGTFGPSTEGAVRAFQQRRGLPSDGRVGLDTWGELVEAGYRLGDRALYLRSPYFRGDDVRELQRRLNQLGFDAGREDGIFGARTGRAVFDFQRNVGATPDGIVGADSFSALARIHPVAPGPSRAVVREAEDVRAMDAALVGSRIAIDPGHGADDPGAVGPTGATEAELALLLASDLADALITLGAIPALLRDAATTPTPSDRARTANELDAGLCISIHLNEGEPTAEGSTCFYFGTEDTYSPAGQRLAEVVQESLTSRLGLKDGRTHRLAIALLRETRMPAVQVEPVFLTNPDEDRLVRDPAGRRRIATAIAQGVATFFEGFAGTAGDVSAGSTGGRGSGPV